MKSNLQFLKTVGSIALLTAGLLITITKVFFSTDIIEHSLEVSEAIRDHCKTTYNCSGMHPPGCSICLTKGEK